jgi:hypothetical protein
MKDPPPRTSQPVEGLIPAHGGYRKLKSFQVAQLCYDVTVRFCDRYVDKHDRTHDQMVQAARSGKQNIAEGSKASGTSKKTEDMARLGNAGEIGQVRQQLRAISATPDKPTFARSVLFPSGKSRIERDRLRYSLRYRESRLCSQPVTAP